MNLLQFDSRRGGGNQRRDGYRPIRGVVSVVMFLALAVTGTAQERGAVDKRTLLESAEAVTNVRAEDHPNDVGTSLDVRWDKSPADREEVKPRRVLRYLIQRAVMTRTSTPQVAAEWTDIGEATYGTDMFVDTNCAADRLYRYRVAPADAKGAIAEYVASEPVGPVVQVVDSSRLGYGAILMLVTGTVLGFIVAARRGKMIRLRPIPALDAVDEAVGRATEMGKPCLFVPGVQDINEMMTVAGVIVLGRVSRTAAEYDCQVLVPTARSLVMTACRETVEAACLTAGRPEAYRADDITYLADEQFAYVAGVTSTMSDVRPAACFYFGQFFAESLFLAEAGNAIGSLQIAGTAETTQLPFFVAACDYTLIGEEFFAASAYLSREPDQLGAVQGQDYGKLLAMSLILAGAALATMGQFPATVKAAKGLEWLQTLLTGG